MGVSQVPLSLNDIIHSIHFNPVPLLAQAMDPGREQISALTLEKLSTDMVLTQGAEDDARGETECPTSHREA